jgi:hypothetical protein
MTVLLLNDTDEGGAHFGCQRVMRTIRAELAARGLHDLPSVKVGTDWSSDPAATALIDAARVVVINGEGTLHHAKRKGRWLLQAGARVKARGGRVALINALWQGNPDDWAALARDFDLLWCRDSRSARDLGQQIGRAVPWIGDLSMFRPAEAIPASARNGVSVSCSVDRAITKRLANFSGAIGARFVPVTAELKTVNPALRGLRQFLRALYARWFTRRFMAAYPATELVRDDTAYLAHLSGVETLVTGRFHAACLAVLTGTPFVAMSSNSWKIEALVADLGLDPARVQPQTALTPALLTSRNWAYSADEAQRIETSLATWRHDGTALFDAVAALSR